MQMKLFETNKRKSLEDVGGWEADRDFFRKILSKFDFDFSNRFIIENNWK